MGGQHITSSLCLQEAWALIIRYSKMVQAMVYRQLDKTLAIFRAFWKYRPKAGELTVLKFRPPFLLPNIYYKTFKSTVMS